MKKVISILVAAALYACDTTKTIVNERANPTSYLSLTQKPWTIGSEYIEGTLTNKASKTDYLNIVLIVQYSSANGVKLGTERIGEYEILKPSASRAFRHEIHPPASTQSLSVIIDRAQFFDVN